MRELIFRAWDGIRITTSGIMFSTTNGSLETPNGAKMKLMQYTGLKDRNGKYIYEGDIMTHPEFKKTDKLKVSIENGCTLLSGWDCLRTDLSKGEVIGNIYENPELL